MGKRGPQQLPRRERFYSHVDKSGRCWLWTGTILQRGGYGSFYDDDALRKRAHRVSWELEHGRAVPDGMVVMHLCDTPACVRPTHLIADDQRENLADMRRKGRGYVIPPERGEARYNAKLTDERVRRLRQARTVSVAAVDALAAEYGVAKNTARKAARGETWRHVTPT